MTTPPLFFTDQGNGEAVVFLHGFCETHALWNSFSAQLSPHFRVIGVDLPGFGQSPLPAGPYTLAGSAEALFQTLQSLKIDQAVLVGHSMGGYVALAFAHQYPQHLKGLCLFHSTSFADSAEKKENRTQSVAFVQEHGGAKFVTSMFPNLFSAQSRQTMPQEVEAYVQQAAQTPEATIIAATLAMRDRPDHSRLLPRLQIPIAFIAGKEDQAVPMEKTLAEISLPTDSTLHLLEGIGHNGMLECPQKTLPMISHFVTYCLETPPLTA